MMRNLCVFILLIFCCRAAGQDSHLLHSSYAMKYNYLNDLNLKYNVNKTSSREVNSELDRLQKWANDNNDNELAGELKLLQLRRNRSNNVQSFESLEREYQQMLKNIPAKTTPYYHADILQGFGDLYCSNQMNAHGFENFIAAYTLYSGLTASEYPAKEHNISSLAGSYSKYGDYENAIKYFKEDIAQPNFILRTNLTVYNSIGLCYRNLAQYDSALSFFKIVYDSAKVYSDSMWEGIASGNIGIVYFYENKYSEAIPMLERDISASMAHHIVKNGVNSMLILAKLYYNEKDYDKSEQLIVKALELSKSHLFWHDFAIREKLFRQAYNLYAAKNNKDLATVYADSALTSMDSNNTKNNALTLAKAEEKIELVQHRIAAKQLENEKKINFYMTMVLALLFLIGILAVLSQMRTVRLNKQITAQKKEVEKLNDVKDWIFSTIGHDLRTPVNSLIAFMQLIEGGDISAEKMKAYTLALRNSLGYTANLMENLLNWAKTQMHGYNAVRERFDIAETTKQVISLVQQEANRKNVVIVNEIPANSIVFADVNMTALVTRNILGNAIKYTAGGGVVTLWAVPVKGYLQIKIQDTGVGMVPELVAHFNNTEHVQPMVTTPGTAYEKGTGLGLMLCKTFAGLMKGKLSVESEPGKGSCFTFVLPTRED